MSNLSEHQMFKKKTQQNTQSLGGANLELLDSFLTMPHYALPFDLNEIRGQKLLCPTSPEVSLVLFLVGVG